MYDVRRRKSLGWNLVSDPRRDLRFSTGKQFVYDTEPKKVNFGPNSMTDEDWIPHSAAWLTGLMRL